MKKAMPAGRQGFTLIEISIVIGSIAILGFLTSVNLINARNSFSQIAQTDVLITNIREQQIKAMVGDTEGRGGAADAYGIHLGADKYTHFHGVNYVANESTNFDTQLGGGVEFSNVMFPDANIIFATGSGEIINFSSGSNSFVIRDTRGGQQKTVIINKYGVITSVN
jgi:type II secretory pathway pseudopilin PulG